MNAGAINAPSPDDIVLTLHPAAPAADATPQVPVAEAEDWGDELEWEGYFPRKDFGRLDEFTHRHSESAEN